MSFVGPKEMKNFARMKGFDMMVSIVLWVYVSCSLQLDTISSDTLLVKNCKGKERLQYL